MASPPTTRPFPGFHRIYLLEDPSSPRAYRGDIALGGLDPFAVTRGEKEPRRAVVRWAMGAKTPSDVIWTTSVAPLILRESIIEALSGEGFAGWRTYGVTVFDGHNSLMTNFCGMAVSGRCGRINDALSKVIDKQFPGGVFPVWKGLYFDPASWDGSDVFMPNGNVGWIFVVEAVKNKIESACVRNVTFISLEEVERLIP